MSALLPALETINVLWECKKQCHDTGMTLRKEWPLKSAFLVWLFQDLSTHPSVEFQLSDTTLRAQELQIRVQGHDQTIHEIQANTMRWQQWIRNHLECDSCPRTYDTDTRVCRSNISHVSIQCSGCRNTRELLIEAEPSLFSLWGLVLPPNSIKPNNSFLALDEQSSFGKSLKEQSSPGKSKDFLKEQSSPAKSKDFLESFRFQGAEQKTISNNTRVGEKRTLSIEHLYESQKRQRVGSGHEDWDTEHSEYEEDQTDSPHSRFKYAGKNEYGSSQEEDDNIMTDADDYDDDL